MITKEKYIGNISKKKKRYTQYITLRYEGETHGAG